MSCYLNFLLFSLSKQYHYLKLFCPLDLLHFHFYFDLFTFSTIIFFKCQFNNIPIPVNIFMDNKNSLSQLCFIWKRGGAKKKLNNINAESIFLWLLLENEYKIKYEIVDYLISSNFLFIFLWWSVLNKKKMNSPK